MRFKVCKLEIAVKKLHYRFSDLTFTSWSKVEWWYTLWSLRPVHHSYVLKIFRFIYIWKFDFWTLQSESRKDHSTSKSRIWAQILCSTGLRRIWKVKNLKFWFSYLKVKTFIWELKLTSKKREMFIYVC